MKRHLIVVLLVISAVVLVTAPTASAGLLHPHLRAYAWTEVDNFHRPVAGIRVTVYDGNGAVRGVGYTDEDGNWPPAVDDALDLYPIANPYRVLFEDPTGYWRNEWYSDANGPDYASSWEEATPINVTMGTYHSIGEDLILAPSDTSPPMTTADYAAPPISGWYQDDPTVALSAVDNAGGSGVAAIYFTLDGGARQTYTAPFTVSGDGAHTVTFWSVDNAGNVEDNTAAANAVSFQIDGTPPTTGATPSGSLGANGWYTSAVSVGLSAEDNLGGSGLVSISYTFDDPTSPTAQWSLYTVVPIVVASEGLHTLSYRAADVAGNISAAASLPVNIDATAPVTSDDYDGQTHTGSVTVKLTANDDTSGIASITYSTDGTSWTTSNADSVDVTVGTIGDSTISYYATDNASNVEAPTKSVTVAVTGEATPPTTTATGLQADSTSGWIKTSQSVTLSATDDSGGSGVKATYYTVDAVQHTYTAPFTVSGNGSHAVTYWSEDYAGNVETAHTGYVNIDTLAPSTSVDYTGAWTNKPVTLHFTGTDLESGVASTQYSTDGNTWVTGTVYTVSRSGQTTIFYRSTDNLGNVETAKQVVVRIDTKAPSIRLYAPKNKATYGLDAVVLAKWSVTDSLSGVASVSAPVASGEPIDTSAAGSFSFTVTATDNAGNTTTKTVTYSVR